MLDDLFKVLIKNGKSSGRNAILETIGYQRSDSPLRLLQRREQLEASGDSDESRDSAIRSRNEQSRLSTPVDKWQFPVYQIESLPVEASSESNQILAGVTPWSPETNKEDSEEPESLLDIETLREMLDGLTISPRQSRQVDIKKMVRKVASIQRLTPLPRIERRLYPNNYSVLIDSIPELLDDVLQLMELFEKLPARLQPTQVRRLHLSRFWLTNEMPPHRIKVTESLNISRDSCLLVVADRRRISDPLRVLLSNIQIPVFWLNPSMMEGCLYWGKGRSSRRSDPVVEQLLALLVASPEFDRALVRKLRLLLGGQTSAEIAFWRHLDVLPNDRLGCEYGSVVGQRDQHKHALTDWFSRSPELIGKAVGIVISHLQKISVSGYHEFRLNVSDDLSDEITKEQANRYFLGLAVALEGTSDDDLKFNLSNCLLNMAERLTVDPGIELQAAIEIAQRYRVSIDPHAPVAVGSPSAWMQGEANSVVLAHSAGGLQLNGFKVRSGVLTSEFQLLGQSAVIDLDSNRKRVRNNEEFSGQSIVVHANNVNVKVETLYSSYFHWAESLQQDANGLTLTTSEGLRIIYPAKTTDGPHPIIDTTQATAWLEQEAVHIDKHGLRATLNIFGIVQVMRWIPPGRFMMGSPEKESGRFDNETLHEVVLSKGYWLADTCCTQSLWKAVMGANPSHFKGENLPVETISWEDIQAFFDKVRARYPELNLQLPTEAQWEHACRAGTTVPFSFGDINREKANYFDGPEDESAEERLKGTTMDVASYVSNPWGLYDMHGNVIEWCSDWYAAYKEDDALNPTGPSNGAARVLRGGSWIRNARYCRSACRGRSEPSDRLSLVGFRFAQVDEHQHAKRQPVESGEGAEQARRSRKSRAVPDGVLGTEKKFQQGRDT